MTGATETERTSGNLLTTATVIAVAAIFGLTYSLTAALIALDLAARGLSETFIGGNAAMHAVGVLGMAPLLPGLAVRYGPRRLILIALAASGILLLLIPLMPAVWLWFPLRLLLGAAADVLFVLSETWVNELTDERARGRTMAIYAAALSMGFASGPLILSAVGVTPWAYVAGAAIAFAAIVPAASRWVKPPARLEKATARPLQYFRLAPLAIAVTALNASGGRERGQAAVLFLPLYAAGLGWTEQQGMFLISMLLVGAIFLQPPLGLLADRMDRRRLMLASACSQRSGRCFGRSCSRLPGSPTPSCSYGAACSSDSIP